MKANYTALVAATVGACLLPAAAPAQALPELKFSGFGTLSAVHSSEKNADFVSTVFQPSGAGHTRSWSFDPDTKLGGQVNAVFNDKLSAVVQVVAKHQYDNSYTPQIEWANVKYQLVPEVSVRAGRIALPAFLLSESRFVGYANPWARPPVEVYNVLPITSNDGVDATWRHQFGSINNSLQAYFGRSNAKLSTATAKAKRTWGINDSVEIGNLALRAGYDYVKADIDVPSLAPLLGGLAQFSAAPAPLGPQAQALLQKYKLDDMNLSMIALGASYDPGNWFLMGEFVDRKGVGFLSDSRSWYASAGYRFGKFTPYAVYSSTKAHIAAEPGIACPCAAAFNAGLGATLESFTPTQNTTSVGLRWDFMNNLALKGQYDRINLGGTANGHLVNPQPGFVPGGHVDLFSITLDFVF